MNDLNLYHIDTDYINYLQIKEREARGFTKVSNNIDINYQNLKPYVGTVLEIGSYKYFVPLTHPKYHYDANSKFFNRISYPIELKNGRKYGRLMFCYMIPLKKESVLSLININEIEDLNYKNVLMSQYFYIKASDKKEVIMNSALSLYSKVKGNPNHFLYSKCCDFEILENACEEY